MRNLHDNNLYMNYDEGHIVIILLFGLIRNMEIFKVVLVAGCGHPGRPGHGKIILKRDGFLLPPNSHQYLRGDVVLYTCDDGYTLLGHKQRQCQGDGTWRHTLPSCGKF